MGWLFVRKSRLRAAEQRQAEAEADRDAARQRALFLENQNKRLRAEVSQYLVRAGVWSK